MLRRGALNVRPWSGAIGLYARVSQRPTRSKECGVENVIGVDVLNPAAIFAITSRALAGADANHVLARSLRTDEAIGSRVTGGEANY